MGVEAKKFAPAIKPAAVSSPAVSDVSAGSSTLSAVFFMAGAVVAAASATTVFLHKRQTQDSYTPIANV
jgi:hypothetical protein